MCTSLDQSVFPARWCADHSKTYGFLAGGISESLSSFSSRLRRLLVITFFRVRLQYRQLRRLTRLSSLLFLLLLLSLMSLRDMCIELNIFYEYLAKLLVPNVTSRINYFTPCQILANLPAVSLKHNSQKRVGH